MRDASNNIATQIHKMCNMDDSYVAKMRERCDELSKLFLYKYIIFEGGYTQYAHIVNNLDIR